MGRDLTVTCGVISSRSLLLSCTSRPLLLVCSAFLRPLNYFVVGPFSEFEVRSWHGFDVTHLHATACQYDLPQPLGLVRADNNLRPWRPDLREVLRSISSFTFNSFNAIVRSSHEAGSRICKI